MNSKFYEVVRLLPLKVFLLFVGFWLLGLTMSILAMTDLFTEPLFQRKNTMMIYLNFSATGIMVTVLIAYFTARRKRRTSKM
jgi:hypothetical protein